MWNNNYKNKNVNRKDEIMYVVIVLYMLAALAWLRDGASAASIQKKMFEKAIWKQPLIEATIRWNKIMKK